MSGFSTNETFLYDITVVAAYSIQLAKRITILQFLQIRIKGGQMPSVIYVYAGAEDIAAMNFK